MRVTFLGTGAAGGVPLYGCTCVACGRARRDPRFVRRPCSALVESGETRVLLDAGLTDLHERFAPGDLDAIVLTHFHPDHVQGLFHLRWGVGTRIPVYGPPDSEGCADLYKHPGVLEFHALSKFEPMTLGDVTLTPLPLIHSKVTFGYAMESSDGARFAYLTDTLGLPPRTEAFLSQWQAHGLALDCSYPPQLEPKNHNDWTTALAVIDKVKPERAWLTHLGHQLDAWLLDTGASSPRAAIARDGDQFELHAASESENRSW
ncbi:phosphonate metabolism protein PhnP [Polaromonas sp.]|uniref:phosphonate metabolism protein PhnP n=1 Tax=Polaromonas sp. TaxID=1869339 RepID=UPI001D84784D|nr:phosphonate metabolism protein PhnP [Polaromonas sp.]MBT9476334.1 phosphonate metabolism protein PhnP [Polaromonas sp.]